MTNGPVAAWIAGLAAAMLTAAPVALAQTTSANQTQLKRGEYLVTFGGCHDCHSPKVMTPNGPAPDKSRLLSGHPADAQLPPLPAGVVGPAPNQWAAVTNSNLTAWVGPWGTSFAAGHSSRSHAPALCLRSSRSTSSMTCFKYGSNRS